MMSRLWTYLHVCVCVSVFVFAALCVDSETSAVRSFGDTWLRWRGQRVEYCRCALQGQERCHSVPVISECDMSADTHKHVPLSPPFLIRLATLNLSLSSSWRVFFLGPLSSPVASLYLELAGTPTLVYFLLAHPAHVSKLPVIPLYPNEELLGFCVSEWE